ncbi:hypothetical protein NDU88_006814 [Pleurodeles waltl]|uniref:Uncharacterized protein n=1 Tax=Pleurodeles waltl TaxID=8319 RepID=A0AAV7RQI8_PLEWA|nr:hypothetical protein NDU88_006814 [Pleurodeles waltl]
MKVMHLAEEEKRRSLYYLCRKDPNPETNLKETEHGEERVKIASGNRRGTSPKKHQEPKAEQLAHRRSCWKVRRLKAGAGTKEMGEELFTELLIVVEEVAITKIFRFRKEAESDIRFRSHAILE